jgi:predicted ATPase
VSTLLLNRLDAGEGTILAETVAGKPLPSEVVANIVDRTDGVPLFVEELTRAVLESGLLREEGDRYALDQSIPLFAIPPSLHASLLARLDRLGPTAKQVAQIAAAISREFSYELLAAVAQRSETELRDALGRLVGAGLVLQREVSPETTFLFKHALVRDAAYGTLLRGPRQALHARIARALETNFPELMESQPELLAQHYAEAGLVEKSVGCWGKAARRSVDRSAMMEAAAQLQKGLDQLTLLPDTPARQRQELEYYSALGTVLIAVKGQAAPETGHAYARARELWEQLGSPSEFLQVPHGQSRYHAARGEFDLALRLDEDLLYLSGLRNDSAWLVLAHYASGRNLVFVGRFAASRSHLEEALALYDPNSHRSLVYQAGINPCANSQAYLGNALFCLGFPDQALARSNTAIAEAQRVAHPASLASSLAIGARLLSLIGDNAALGERVDQLVSVATEQGFPFYRALGTIFRGWATIKNDAVTEGMSLLRSGSMIYRATEARVWMPHNIALLASACEIAGQIDEALSLTDEALQIVDRTGELWFAAELNRHKGQLLLRQGNTDAAEELYHKALGIAEEQEAKLWGLRAAVSLARLRRDQGRPAEARDLLAPIYGWFTEGFNTKDLKEAKTLLDELS